MFHPRHRSSVQIRFLAAAALAGVTLLAARPAAAEWITGVSAADPLVLSDDFEAPVGPGNGYTLGQSPVDVGPWEGTTGTTGNNYNEVTAGNGGQVSSMAGHLSSTTTMYYTDPHHSAATDYYFDFDYLPGVNSEYDRYSNNAYKQLVLNDTNGGKGVLVFGVTDDNDPSNPNRYYVRIGGSTVETYYGSPITGADTTKVQLFLHSVNAANKQWEYTLYLDGQRVADAVAFDTTVTGASKANQARFQSKWQDNALTSVDNFNWRTDGFVRPIPEPGTMGLMLLGAVIAASQRRRRAVK